MCLFLVCTKKAASFCLWIGEYEQDHDAWHASLSCVGCGIQKWTGVKSFGLGQYGVYMYTVDKFNCTTSICMKTGCVASEYVYTVPNSL